LKKIIKTVRFAVILSANEFETDLKLSHKMTKSKNHDTKDQKFQHTASVSLRAMCRNLPVPVRMVPERFQRSTGTVSARKKEKYADFGCGQERCYS
jgi:hypothetical protein